jgi:DNA replication protein
MPAFPGFPPGETPYTPLPEAFFTALLPEIEDIGELKVTLHLYWLLYQKQGTPRCASDRELLADPQLRRALRRLGDPRPYEERLRVALELAHARGTLLRVRVRVDGEIVTWYFFNTEKSRQAVARLLEGTLSPEILLELEGPLAALNAPAVYPLPAQADRQNAEGDTDSALVSADTVEATPRQGLGSGEARPGMITPLAPPSDQNTPRYHSLRLEIERPNIYALYEQNIGLLLPLVAEELREAEERYPWEWVEAAFREAVQQNKRKWSYIRAILQRWEVEGKGGEPYGAHGRYSR